MRLLRPDKEDVARNKREEQERRGDRRVYSHEEYIGLVLRSGSMIRHFYVICVCVGRGLENKDYNHSRGSLPAVWWRRLSNFGAF